MPKGSGVVAYSSSDAIYVVQLTDAEKKARDIVDSARRRKLAHLKKARDESGIEVDLFKRQCEENLTRILKENASGQDLTINQFEKDLDIKTNELKQLFMLNFQSTLNNVCNIVFDIQVKFHENLKI